MQQAVELGRASATVSAVSAIRDGLRRFVPKPGLRAASASNFVTYVLAVLASLGSFRLMIELTDTPTVGLWAMILGFATLAAVAEMGLGVNLTRYVASRGNVSQLLVARLTAVGAIICLLPAAVLAGAIALPLYRFAVTRPDLPITPSDVAALTALALGATLVNAANVIFAGLAEGLGRVALRSAAILSYNLVTLSLLWPAVAWLGPRGLGIANLAGVSVQLAVVLTVLVLTVRKLPLRADEERIGGLMRLLRASTMRNFGIALARIPIEPIARFYVALVGSLTVQAWFELALRVSNQVRQVVLNSLQPLLYVGASNQAKLTERFARPRAFTVRLSALLFLALMCGSPLISAVVLGQVEPGFIVFLLILGLGGAFAINGNPGYFALAARDQFGLLLKYTLAITAIDAVLGGAAVVLGAGAAGVVAGLSAALGIGGLLLMRSLAQITGQSFRSQFAGFWPGTLAAVAVGAGLALAATRLSPAAVVALGAAAGLLLIAPAWALVRMFLHRG